MFFVLSYPGENLGKVCKNSRAGKNPRLHLAIAFSRIREFSPTVDLGFHQTMKA